MKENIKPSIEERIKQEVEECGLLIEDLTQDELNKLKEEIIERDNGATILDGVLFSIPIYERIAKRELKNG